VAEAGDAVRVTPVFREGAPAAEIVAESESLDLLFMGSRGYGPLRAVLLGGVTGAVVRDASCPVLITPRGGTGVEAGAHAVASAA
jgi:nucleotide-binding universal stress UspA family protein